MVVRDDACCAAFCETHAMGGLVGAADARSGWKVIEVNNCGIGNLVKAVQGRAGGGRDGGGRSVRG